MARSARGTVRSTAGSLQPFQPLLVSWSGRGELKTLTGAERSGAAAPIGGERLFSALYVNELLVRALAPHDAHATLFDAYACLLPTLAVAVDPEPLLRAFELALLRELGYALDFTSEAGHGGVLEPAAMYAWEPGLGFLSSPGAPETHAYPGWSLAAIGSGEFTDPQTRRFAKRLLREALAPLTGERPGGRRLRSLHARCRRPDEHQRRLRRRDRRDAGRPALGRDPLGGPQRIRSGNRTIHTLPARPGGRGVIGLHTSPRSSPVGGASSGSGPWEVD